MKSEDLVRIIVAVIGAAALIIAAFVGRGFYLDLKYMDVRILVTNEQNAPLFEAKVNVTDQSGKPVTAQLTKLDGTAKIPQLPKGKYTFMVSASGYDTAVREIDGYATDLDIVLTKPVVGILPFSLSGWSPWGGVTVTSPEANTAVFNGGGSGEVSGYVNERVNRNMAGNTLVLEIRNTAYSRFSGNRLLKMTVNRSDDLLTPVNVPALLFGEYLPAHDGQVEFVLPRDFDGKLGFVFYNANLNNLQISAFYK
jgi:hypothetical protein